MPFEENSKECKYSYCTIDENDLASCLCSSNFFWGDPGINVE